MKPAFKEKKTTQAAIFLIKKEGGKMNYTKLIKLLYLADREFLIKWGHPITYDSHVSMENGPVLSCTYDKIKAFRLFSRGFWIDHIRTRDYDVEIISDADIDELSKAEIETLESIYEKNKDKDWKKLVFETHQLPEWKNTTSSIPIDYSDILSAAGKSKEDIDLVNGEIEHLAEVEKLFQ